VREVLHFWIAAGGFMKKWLVGILACAVAVTACKKEEPVSAAPEGNAPEEAMKPAEAPTAAEAPAPAMAEKPMDAAGLVQAIVDLHNAGKYEESLKYFADDLSETWIGSPMPPIRSKADLAKVLADIKMAFPDAHLGLRRVIELSPDLAAIQFVFTGTQSGPFMGMPPSGKKVGYEIIRIAWRDGNKVKKVLTYANTAAMMSQIKPMGGMPSAPIPMQPSTTDVVKLAPANPANLEVVKKLYAAIESPTLAGFGDVAAPEIVYHDTVSGKDYAGLDGNKTALTEWKKAFPDLKIWRLCTSQTYAGSPGSREGTDRRQRWGPGSGQFGAGPCLLLRSLATLTWLTLWPGIADRRRHA
jgi:steroid delta-isomerase-like uncharacterized protein